MILSIKSVKDKSTVKERIVLNVLEDGNTGDYFTFIVKINGDKKILANTIEKPFWFPDKVIKKGDLVVLYSKVGMDSFKVNTDGTTSHFFYRNQLNPIFKLDSFGLILEASNWGLEKEKEKDEDED